MRLAGPALLLGALSMPAVASATGEHMAPYAASNSVASLHSSSLAATSGPERASVIVAVTGLRNAKGKVRVALFDNSSAFPNKRSAAVAVRSASAVDGLVQIAFDDLAPGTYAAAVLHDENANGEMEKSVMGIPLEGYAITGKARTKLREPRFDEADFVLEAGETRAVRASMIYMW